METIAARHGIYLAPLYNADGAVEDALHCETQWSSVENARPSRLPELGEFTTGGTPSPLDLLES